MMKSVLKPVFGNTESQRFSVFLSEFAYSDPVNPLLLQEICSIAWHKCGFRSCDPLDLMTFRTPNKDFGRLRERALRLMGLHARAFCVRVPSAKVAVIPAPPHVSTLLLTDRASGPYFLQIVCEPAGAVSGLSGDSLSLNERRTALEAVSVKGLA